MEICLGIINSMDLKKAASLCIFTIQGVPILILLCIPFRVGTSCSIRVSMHFKDIEFDFHYSRNGKRKILVDNEILWKKAIFNYILILLSDSSIYDERTISKPHEC